MNKIHVTREGQKMFISQMDDSHLLNTVKMICRNIEECKSLSAYSPGISGFQKKLMGLDDEKLQNEMFDKIKEYSEMLVYYVAETSLRGLNVSSVLQSAFERSEKLPKFEIPSNSPSQLIDYEDDDEIPW
jgi:hypothetical protein